MPKPQRPKVVVTPADAARRGRPAPARRPTPPGSARLAAQGDRGKVRDVAHSADLPPDDSAGAQAWLDWAQASGRITASSRAHWASEWSRDPATARGWLSVLASTTSPPPAPARTAAASTPAAASPAPVVRLPTPAPQTASGLDVSALPSRLRAAAAREPDRGKVFRILEKYSGVGDDELDVQIMQVEGEHELAAGMTREDNARRVVEMRAWGEAERAAWAKHAEAVAIDAEGERQTQARAIAAESERRGEGGR